MKHQLCAQDFWGDPWCGYIVDAPAGEHPLTLCLPPGSPMLVDSMLNTTDTSQSKESD